MSQIRIGIIGAGGMGNHHTREILRRNDARVTTMCDTSEVSMDRLVETLGAAATGVSRYPSYEELLSGEELDAVVSPPPIPPTLLRFVRA